MSEEAKHKIFSTTDCIPEQTMFDYIDNKLSPKERNTVEKHLLDCELCSDAMEGLELVKDRKRIAMINQKVNEFIASKNERKIIAFNYRTITGIAAGLLLLIGSVYFFKTYTSDNIAEEKGVAELKEPMPPPSAEMTEAEPSVPDSTPTVTSLNKTKGLSETETTKQPLAYHQEEKTEGYNKAPVASGAGTVSTTPPAGNTIIQGQTSNDLIIVSKDADDEKLKTDEYKKDEKENTDKNTYSWTPAPSNAKLEKEVVANDNAQKPENKNVNRSRSLFKSKERSPTTAWESPKSDADKDGLSKDEPITLSNINSDSVYTIADEMPEYPGGTAELGIYLRKNIPHASDNKESIYENFIIQFIINKEGKAIEPKLLGPQNIELEKQVIEMVNKMPLWKPGKQKGRNVSVLYILPVKFSNK